ncbi:hypothetical protein [Saccharopolyspora sp. NPDC002686]
MASSRTSARGRVPWSAAMMPFATASEMCELLAGAASCALR